MTSPGGLIRIGELSRRVGLSVDRLRAWERRYGLLRPQRTAGGFRLYSTADEQRVRAMQRQLAAGLAPAQAAAAVLTAEPPTVDRPSRPEQLRDALVSFDAVQAHAILDGLFADAGADETMRAVIFPLLRELGERWARAEITVGHEHFASRLLEARLLALLRSRSQPTGPLALLACAPGELHTLGLIGFGVALHNRGWRVIYLGADTPIDDVRSAAAELSPAVAVLSAVMAARFADIEAELRELARQLPLALAGAGAGPAMTQRVGAQLLDGDPVTAADAVARTTL